MGSHWLDVTTDEIRARRDAQAQLDQRRAGRLDAAQHCLTEVVQPVFEAVAEQRGWQLQRVDPDRASGPPALRMVGEGLKPAWAEVGFDTLTGMAVLRRHPGGAGSKPAATALRCGDLDRDGLTRWLTG
ncbi:hypothetical protein [Spectribacter hydrogenoxidans]|uniref:Uncharacterized protein n=1 Tax=Spectribacter hydrogenoxidans TaxID=3075608 RepID=A0ABU3C1L6_9GAMM|nr:hypothetical protein [Salinisphaera sp. W335]MDT0635460.1 hypothetical protein [Salinisphaera sp. W335]